MCWRTTTCDESAVGWAAVRIGAACGAGVLWLWSQRRRKNCAAKADNTATAPTSGTTAESGGPRVIARLSTITNAVLGL